MFTKSISALVLLMHSSTLVSAEITAQIGYTSSLVPGLPGPEPGVGCGLWARASSDGQTASADYGGKKPTDGCPAAEVKLFCSRWGCPFEMKFDNVIDLTVESDNPGDKSLTVTATGLNGRTATITCPWATETISDSDSGSIYQDWSCDLSEISA